MKDMCIDLMSREKFEEILKENQLLIYISEQIWIDGMIRSVSKEWMYAFYCEEAERYAGNIQKSSKGPKKSEFIKRYVYNQKTKIINGKMLLYIQQKKEQKEGGQRERNWIWKEMFQLYESIKLFHGLQKYQNVSIKGYSSSATKKEPSPADEWLQEVYTDAIYECMKRYDPEKKESFVGYTIDIYKFRIIDFLRKNSRKEEKEKAVHTAKETDCIEQIKVAVDPEMAEAYFNLYMPRLISLIIQLYEKQSGKATGLKKSDYYRFFFTENVIKALKDLAEDNWDSDNLSNEEEVIRTACIQLMDYVMTEICRTYPEIMDTPIKTYHDIINNNDNRQIAIPIGEIIYADFVNNVLDLERSQESIAASISKYRTKYNEEMKVLILGMKKK